MHKEVALYIVKEAIVVVFDLAEPADKVGRAGRERRLESRGTSAAMSMYIVQVGIVLT